MHSEQSAKILSIPSALSLGLQPEEGANSLAPKIYVLHENSDWFQPLEQALQKFGLPFEEWFIHEGKLDLSSPPPLGVFYNRMSASSHTRGHRYGPEFTISILAWLESHGRFVLNGWKASALEISKVVQYQALQAQGVNVPRTIAAVGKRALLDAADSFSEPFITKHNRGGKGLGVQLFQNKHAFTEYLQSDDFESSLDGIVLLQEFIESSDNSITRVEFVDQEFLYAVRVDTSEGFELCPADTCQIGDAFCPAGAGLSTQKKQKFEIIENFDTPDLPNYKKLMKKFDIHIAAFEFITDERGERYTYDINVNTNYNSAAERAGVRGMEQIAKVLGQRLGQLSKLNQASAG